MSEKSALSNDPAQTGDPLDLDATTAPDAATATDATVTEADAAASTEAEAAAETPAEAQAAQDAAADAKDAAAEGSEDAEVDAADLPDAALTQRSLEAADIEPTLAANAQTDAEAANADEDAADAAAADADNTEAAEATTASSPEKHRKEKVKPLTKEEQRILARAERDAERERIARSKRIAAEARGKRIEPHSKAVATNEADAHLTRDQARAKARDAAAAAHGDTERNAPWFKPIMFGFLLLGLLWIIVFYISQGVVPIAALGNWNILVGFGIALVGFLMMSNWKS